MKTNRGIRLFTELVLFPQDGGQDESVEGRSQGRSAALIRKRNERLCGRLFWYRKFTKLDYEVVKLELEDEFEISVTTIVGILQEDEWLRELARLKVLNPELSFFRKQWPKMVWKDVGGVW